LTTHNKTCSESSATVFCRHAIQDYMELVDYHPDLHPENNVTHKLHLLHKLRFFLLTSRHSTYSHGR